MKRSIVWGTCWFNESLETLIEFYNSSIKSLKKMNFDVIPIIFDAKYEDNQETLDLICENIDDVIIIKNDINIFPNKNYGVALITNKAYELNAMYTAIVDSDWNIKENYSFIQNIVGSLMNNNLDIMIPNIGDASGRSNILIGRTAITLFYPEYKEIIKTAFPGSIVAITSKLYTIVNNENYHFDWGGEWDIISIAISTGMKINSSYVEVQNIRHRPNTSKIYDSFQIWRAILGNKDIIDRVKYINDYDKNIIPYNNISKTIMEKDVSVLELIHIFENNNISETERQILYMILYPIAYLTGNMLEIPTIQQSDKLPYDKYEINKISDFAIYCAKQILSKSNIVETYNRCQILSGGYLSTWNHKIQNELLNGNRGDSK